MKNRHKVAIVKEFGKPLVIEEVPTPEPKDRQVLVKVISAGICHTDVHIWKGDWASGGLPPKLPFVISHEIVGEVVAKGDRVPDNVKIGEKVLVYAWGWAEEDEWVIKGLTHLNDRPLHLGVTAEGGLREYFLVQDYRFLVDVEGLEDLPTAAPLACAGLTTYRATKKILPFLDPDDYVLVVGLGGLGSYQVQWLRALARHVNVIGADVKDEAISFVDKISKLDFAVNASKTDPVKAIMEATKGKGVKAVVDLVANAKTIGTYLNVLAKTGIYMLVGMMGVEATIGPLVPFIASEKAIMSSVVGTLRDQIEVIRAARKGLVNYSAVVTRRLKLEEATEALEALEKGKVIGRQIVVFD
ncbi:MAG: alcohol dehydrogenase catalytic domain-containing protein [Ignisphaera sp.]